MDQAKFNAPEFSSVFNRIVQKKNKEGFYCVRLLNKFHSRQLDEKIDSANLNIQNLPSLTTSKFADQIQNLSIRIPGDLEDLSELSRASTEFLPNIQNTNIVFTKRHSKRKFFTLSQASIFRGFNVVRKNHGGRIEIQCQNHDIQIINSIFNGIGVFLNGANKITVRNVTFINIPPQSLIQHLIQENFGLDTFNTQNTITIDNINFFNCLNGGLRIHQCLNNVSINKFYAENCEVGCFFVYVFGELTLNYAEIVNCSQGMQFTEVNNNAVIQYCNIIGASFLGISLHGSTVQYRQVFISKSDDAKTYFMKVDLDQSTFTEIL